MNLTGTALNLKISKEEVINDYKIACISRQVSLLGRKEVFLGKAKFGIFGDGKEVAQIAMAKAFRKGDFRSGYYRDQTFMFALGVLTVQQYFAQLYAHTSLEDEPASAGRLMNGHFATRFLDEKGNWKKQTDMYNSASDVSPTSAQMPRLVGLAWASKVYRNNPQLSGLKEFSVNGNEIAFGTIGNAATSEGGFFEAMNAAGVLQIPMLTAIWDDGYGISVPNELHTTKQNIYKALQGFQRTPEEPGIELITVKGYDYPALVEAFRKGAELCRNEHVPVMIHVEDLTQPQGHSTSGSHERYKSKERLKWEADHDGMKIFKKYIVDEGIATLEELDKLEKEITLSVRQDKDKAWQSYAAINEKDRDEGLELLKELEKEQSKNEEVAKIRKYLEDVVHPLKQDTLKALKKAIRVVRLGDSPVRKKIVKWLKTVDIRNQEDYSSHQYSQSEDSSLKVKVIKPTYSEKSPVVDGREVLQACFDAALSRDPRVVAFGEDVGKIGDVNQAFAGLQAKYGDVRVQDTSIRELTIIGQGIGAAMRGLRPIAEIQYVDYLIYAIQIMSDDLACLQYRTKGGQKAPVIIRTRGHRLEGVWHAGSPMSMILNGIRGIHLLVPRDMTQAAGFYNTLLQSDDPAIIVECLNGYRLKERIPDNVMEFTVPLGQPEVLRKGTDITIVTYGSMCKIAMQAAIQLEKLNISLEVIDVQSLLPFDINHSILESLKKTNRVIFADEDVPGGASAFMMQKVLEEQGGYYYLDSKPVTLTSKEHRPAYASDGDYFSKPNVDDVIDYSYKIMNEVNPAKYPDYYAL